MADTRLTRISRRSLIAAALPAFAASRALAAGALVVTLLGDSITAGLGLAQKDALPAQLQTALQRLGVAAAVRGAGVSGDTSADGAARMDYSIGPDTALVVVALGGNDLLQGLDPKATYANLERIVRRVKQRGMGVILTGLLAPPEIGAGYAKDYDAVFPRLARAEHVTLFRDLMAGIGRNPALKQSDAIHPNAAGVKIIAAKLAPVVAKALATRRRR